MGSFFQSLIALLTIFPGNLAYYLVLTFAVAGALQGTSGHWQANSLPQGRRMALGLGLLLGVQFLQFASAAVAVQDPMLAQRLLPPLDRAVTGLSVLLIAWLWLLPEPSRNGDMAAWLVAALNIGVLVFGLVWWSSQDVSAGYNGSWPDFLSNALALLVALSALLALLLRRPPAWPVGLSTFTLLLVGHLLPWLLPETGSSFSGLVRLAHLAAFPGLLALPARYPADTELTTSTTDNRASTATGGGRLLTGLAELVSGTPDLTEVQTRLPRLFAEHFLADICLLTLPPDQLSQIKVVHGFNLIEEKELAEFTLDGRTLPMIASSMRRNRLLRLPPTSTSPDLFGLTRSLGIKRTGQIIAIPITQPGALPMMGLIMLTPYSNRGWSAEDQTALSTACQYVAYIFSNLREIERLKQSNSQLGSQAQQHSGQDAQFNQSLAENARLRQERDAAVAQSQQERSRAESLVQMMQQPSSLSGASEAETQELRAELKLAQGEINQLHDELRAAQLRVSETAPDQPAHLELPPPGAAIQIALEMRQPLATAQANAQSLLNAADLPASGTRRSAERLQVAVERINGLLDDLLQTTQLQAAGFSTDIEVVDLNGALDEAVASVMAPLREKNILLRMEIPDNLPRLRANPPALQEMLVRLLQHAGAVTPYEGQIGLQAKAEPPEGFAEFVIIQVTDSGPALSPADLPALFSTLSNGQGGGNGLATVKTLVETHGGRIWVDTLVGRGSVFNLLLPAAANASTD